MEFKTHFIAKYEKMLAANGGTTMGQEGYGSGGAYDATDDDRSSLEESIVQYDERATQAKGKVNELERRLAALEMGPPPSTITKWILCPTNDIWHDARRISPTYLHPDPTSIPPAATTE